MIDFELTVNGLTKEFNRRSIFRDLSFTLAFNESLAITGRNGSGKSTLVKTLCGLLAPTRGKVEYRSGGTMLEIDDAKHKVGLVSPYLQLYDEFTGLENLLVLSNIRANGTSDHDRALHMLERFGLGSRQDDYVRTYSSGMKQRLKYCFALLHTPQALFLDEPTSNLDAEGIEIVKAVVREQRNAGFLVVATNDEQEAGWCQRRIDLG